MSASGIAMSPMNDTPLWIPCIFPEELNQVAITQCRNSRCQINVMGYQYGLPRVQTQDESLVPAAITIVWKNPNYLAMSFNLDITLLVFESRRNQRIAMARFRNVRPIVCGVIAPEIVNKKCRYQDEG